MEDKVVTLILTGFVRRQANPRCGLDTDHKELWYKFTRQVEEMAASPEFNSLLIRRMGN